MGLIEQGLAVHGTAIFALEQYAGKGQRGKSWTSEPGSNIILSTIIENQSWENLSPFTFSATIALAVYDFFAKYAGEETSIKWPNDIYWRDRKAVGMLIETKITQDGKWQWAVAGTGININQTSFPDGSSKFVSLKQITGKQWDVIGLARELCNCQQQRLEWLHSQTPAGIMEAYNKVLFCAGKTVQIRYGAQQIQTEIVKVDEQGRLHTRDTIERTFQSGEVVWIR